MTVEADESPHRDFWDAFHTTWRDMGMVNALIHEGAPDWVIHEAMSVAREGRLPDIDPKTHRNPQRRTRWVPSGIGTGGAGMIIRREDEVGDE
jgi:hypothetical protein